MKRVVLALLLPSLLLPVVLLPALLLPTLLLPAANATASEAPFERSEQRSPCTDYDPLRRAFFGDTHVHTALSFDAWGQPHLRAGRVCHWIILRITTVCSSQPTIRMYRMMT